MATAAKPSGWKFVKLGFQLRTKTAAQKSILLVLANHADKNGVCWPAYDTLLRETKLRSKTTINSALDYLRHRAVIDWERGWGNAYDARSNHYQFHPEKMSTIVDRQEKAALRLAKRKADLEEKTKAKAGASTPDELARTSDASPVQPDASSVDANASPVQADASPVEGGAKSTSCTLTSKLELPIYTNVQELNVEVQNVVKPASDENLDEISKGLAADFFENEGRDVLSLVPPPEIAQCADQNPEAGVGDSPPPKPPAPPLPQLSPEQWDARLKELEASYHRTPKRSHERAAAERMYQEASEQRRAALRTLEVR